MRTSLRRIGMDIGGTKIAIAAVESPDRIVAAAEIPTRAEEPFSTALPRILQAVDGVLTRAAWTSCDGIGIGCAGPVDPQRGTVHNPYTLPGWEDADVVAPLADRFAVPVCLENDVDAALVGEWQVGAARGATIAVMLTFGTGVGSAVLIDGRIYRGVRGEHPELGHMVTEPGGPECYCGACGCLEILASGPAIAAAGRALGLPDSRAVFRAAAEGNAAAKRIVDRALSATTTTVWSILHTFLPERIILGGGIMQDQYSLFAEAIERVIGQATLVPPQSVSVAHAARGSDAGVIGAAYLLPCRGEDA